MTNVLQLFDKCRTTASQVPHSYLYYLSALSPKIEQ